MDRNNFLSLLAFEILLPVCPAVLMIINAELVSSCHLAKTLDKMHIFGIFTGLLFLDTFVINSEKYLRSCSAFTRIKSQCLENVAVV